jgi:hypothetical protein
MSKQPVNQEENNDGTEASASEFLCAVACNEGLEKIVHVVLL